MKPAFIDLERVEQCPDCSSSSIRTIHEPDIGCCETCHLYFRNPRPTQAEIVRSYDTGATFDAWQAQENERAAMWKRRARLLAKFQPGDQLLDVGRGDGRFLETCRELGYEVTGTEVSQAGADYARRRGLDVRMGQIVDLELPRDHFDVVTIWHVLEHVPDPRAVLQEVYSLLKPGGVLLVAMPNEENFFIRDSFGKAKGSPFDPLRFGGEIHLTYFRPATLHATLRAAGFRVIDFGVDDAYHLRDLKMRAKLTLQQWLAGTFRWHFAVAMYAVARREEPSRDSPFSAAA